MARRIVDLGGVHVAGRRQRQCSRIVVEGEIVEMYLDGMPLDPYRISPETILFRDDYLLILNKPAGIETQPTPARYQGTLYAALLELLRNPFRPQLTPQLGMVQRLDRETSGVIAFSIHQRSHRALTEAFTQRKVRKRYLALVAGIPEAEQAELVSSLARGRDNRVRSVVKGGREAITRYRTLRAWDEAALLEVELLTGRSHQIRAHLSEAGHPLLGDVRYGGPSTIAGQQVPRQMLHSATLELNHPVTGKPMCIEAPLPPDMVRIETSLAASATE